MLGEPRSLLSDICHQRNFLRPSHSHPDSLLENLSGSQVLKVQYIKLQHDTKLLLLNIYNLGPDCGTELR